MRKTLLAVSALTALAAAMPAAAQYRDRYSNQYDQGRYGQEVSFDARIDALRMRLYAGVRAGTIDRREAWPLRRELAELDRLENRYSLNGYSEFERDDLRRRLRELRADIRVADNGNWDRNERYGMWDEYDGRYTGRGGPLEEDVVVCENRRGVSGFIDQLTGQRNCYTVGQRVSGDLDPVPYAYRDRYRDDGRSYFRSDGRNIYEIDARTNTVIEVHRIPR